MSKLTRKNFAFETEAYKRMQEAQQKAEEEAQYKPAPETNGKQTSKPSSTKKQPQKKVDADLGDFRKEYLRIRKNTKKTSKEKSEPGKYTPPTEAKDPAKAGRLMGMTPKSYSLDLPTKQEPTLSSYSGDVPKSNAEAKEKAKEDMQRDAAKKEQDALQTKRMLANQDEAARINAYTEAFRQSRQANARKEKEEALRNSNKQSWSDEGRPGGGYNNSEVKPTKKQKQQPKINVRQMQKSGMMKGVSIQDGKLALNDEIKTRLEKGFASVKQGQQERRSQLKKPRGKQY